jgi:hypothetical protein
MRSRNICQCRWMRWPLVPPPLRANSWAACRRRTGSWSLSEPFFKLRSQRANFVLSLAVRINYLFQNQCSRPLIFANCTGDSDPYKKLTDPEFFTYNMRNISIVIVIVIVRCIIAWYLNVAPENAFFCRWANLGMRRSEQPELFSN